jgi:Cu/Ag efflux pump CusA
MSTDAAEKPGGNPGIIARVIAFSAHNRFLVLLLTVIACAGAVWCVQRIPLDALPDLSDGERERAV